MKNRVGKFAVPCQVTDRWLQFAPASADVEGGEFITIDLMTGQDTQRRLARVVVTRTDLRDMLARIRLK